MDLTGVADVRQGNYFLLTLEDSLAVDLFAPVREDWIRGDDAYLRGPASR